MPKTLVQQQFGAHAAAYVTSPVHAKGESLKRLVELIKPEASWHVLDIATGAGHTALALAPHVARVVAGDITGEMLDTAAKLAKDRGVTNVETVTAGAEALPFTAACFDLVTCRIAARHFTDVPRFVAEARRVLKPGGVFALVDNISPDRESTPGFTEDELRDAALAYNAFEKLRDPSHGRCLSIGEWTEVIRAASFAITHMERLPKNMEFGPWVQRMSCDAAATEQLRVLLADAAPALAAFLEPQQRDGVLWFTLDEILILARKTTHHDQAREVLAR